MKSVCVYCGSSPGLLPEYQTTAAALGRTLAEQQITLIYGGGSVGLMGIVADACLAANGNVIGIIPQKLMDKEVGHTGLTAMHVVANMHQRKAKMIELAEGFIAMPGAYGTLDELFEALSWLQLGYHAHPVGLLNVAHYFDDLLKFIHHSTAQRFLREPHRDNLLVDTDIDSLLTRMKNFAPENADKWLDRVAKEQMVVG